MVKMTKVMRNPNGKIDPREFNKVMNEYQAQLDMQNDLKDMMEDNFEDMESGDIDQQAEDYLNTFEVDMQKKYGQQNMQQANAQ